MLTKKFDISKIKFPRFHGIPCASLALFWLVLTSFDSFKSRSFSVINIHSPTHMHSQFAKRALGENHWVNVNLKVTPPLDISHWLNIFPPPICSLSTRSNLCFCDFSYFSQDLPRENFIYIYPSTFSMMMMINNIIDDTTKPTIFV